MFSFPIQFARHVSSANVSAKLPWPLPHARYVPIFQCAKCAITCRQVLTCLVTFGNIRKIKLELYRIIFRKIQIEQIRWYVKDSSRFAKLCAQNYKKLTLIQMLLGLMNLRNYKVRIAWSISKKKKKSFLLHIMYFYILALIPTFCRLMQRMNTGRNLDGIFFRPISLSDFLRASP